MTFEIISKEPIQLCGLSVELTRSQQTNYGIIRNHWQKFNAEIRKNKITLGTNWQKYGVTIKRGESYFYLTAAPFNHTNFEMLEIKGGDFALFHHSGSMALIKTSIYDIYKNEIPHSNLKIDSKRELIHYEFYDSRFNWNKSESIIDIFVPVIKF